MINQNFLSKWFNNQKIKEPNTFLEWDERTDYTLYSTRIIKIAGAYRLDVMFKKWCYNSRSYWVRLSSCDYKSVLTHNNLEEVENVQQKWISWAEEKAEQERIQDTLVSKSEVRTRDKNPEHFV